MGYSLLTSVFDLGYTEVVMDQVPVLWHLALMGKMDIKQIIQIIFM